MIFAIFLGKGVRLMKYIISLCIALAVVSTTRAATLQIQPDQRSWLSPTTTNSEVESITLSWGSTELVVNGGFETDNWAGALNSTTTAFKVSGLQSLLGQGVGNVQQDVDVTGDVGATYNFSGWGAEGGGNISRFIVTAQAAVNDVQVKNLTNDIAVDGFVNYTHSFVLGPGSTKIRVNLNRQSGTGTVYWDDISVRPDSLYVYRSSSPFTNTSAATLIATLDGDSATGYTDSGIVGGGVFYYAVSATNAGVNITSFEGTAIAVPEPASLILMACLGVCFAQFGQRRLI